MSCWPARERASAFAPRPRRRRGRSWLQNAGELGSGRSREHRRRLARRPMRVNVAWNSGGVEGIRTTGVPTRLPMDSGRGLAGVEWGQRPNLRLVTALAPTSCWDLRTGCGPPTAPPIRPARPPASLSGRGTMRDCHLPECMGASESPGRGPRPAAGTVVRAVSLAPQPHEAGAWARRVLAPTVGHVSGTTPRDLCYLGHVRPSACVPLAPGESPSLPPKAAHAQWQPGWQADMCPPH